MQRHPRLQQVLAVLLRLWDAFELPPNPLDHLTELLGGPDQVRCKSRFLPKCPAPSILTVDASCLHVNLFLTGKALMRGSIRKPAPASHLVALEM